MQVSPLTPLLLRVFFFNLQSDGEHKTTVVCNYEYNMLLINLLQKLA